MCRLLFIISDIRNLSVAIGSNPQGYEHHKIIHNIIYKRYLPYVSRTKNFRQIGDRQKWSDHHKPLVNHLIYQILFYRIIHPSLI